MVTLAQQNNFMQKKNHITKQNSLKKFKNTVNNNEKGSKNLKRKLSQEKTLNKALFNNANFWKSVEAKDGTKPFTAPAQIKTKISLDNSNRRTKSQQKNKDAYVPKIVITKRTSNTNIAPPKYNEVNQKEIPPKTKPTKKQNLNTNKKDNGKNSLIAKPMNEFTFKEKEAFSNKITNILDKFMPRENANLSPPQISPGKPKEIIKPNYNTKDWNTFTNWNNSILKDKLIQMIQNQRTNVQNNKTSTISATRSPNPFNKVSKLKPKLSNSAGKKSSNNSHSTYVEKEVLIHDLQKPITPRDPVTNLSCPMTTIVINKPTGHPNVQNRESTNTSLKKVDNVRTVPANSALKKPLHQSSTINSRDEIHMLRERVDEAIKQKKTFTMYGHYYSVRNALTSRGWIERLNNAFTPNNCDNSLIRRLQLLTIPELAVGLKDKDFGHVYKQVIMSKMIGNQPVALYWDLNRESYRNNLENYKHALINFIGKTRFNYANKQGLCECTKQSHWFNNPGVSYLRVPRSYCLINNGDPDEFINDFKISAAISFLKWIIATYENNKSKLISECGRVPITYFHFALQECAKFARKLMHEDIDKDIPIALPQEWQDFLENFYKVVHVGNHFKETHLETELSLVHKSKTMLNKLRKMWPFIDMDGYMNIWILKPSFGSRGVGIYFCKTLQYVLKVLREHKNNSYVIQKYIERPLLVHNTKFDIRQWFLISSTQPLTIWIYKECYLRFSSQTYNLRKLHESIHLTNNSVQSKYHNGNRDPGLPQHNMWFLKDFKDHLSNLGYPNVFNDVIYPGMKECITAAILATQDQINRATNAFELHGADFMITEDFMPWLIEINSKPALNPSTPVTSKLCPAVLEDVIKVVVDYARNSRASTGNFELLYKESILDLPIIEDQALQIKGQPIDPKYFLTPEEEKSLDIEQFGNPSGDSINIIKTTDYMKYIGKEMKNTLKQLLALFEKEKERRRKAVEENVTVDLESLECCEDMEKIKCNMKEIQEVFKLEDDRVLHSSESINLKTEPKDEKILFCHASNTLLNKNSEKIKDALSSLGNQQEADNSLFSNIMDMIERFTLQP